MAHISYHPRKWGNKQNGWRGGRHVTSDMVTDTSMTSRGNRSFGPVPINRVLKQQTTIRGGGKITLPTLKLK